MGTIQALSEGEYHFSSALQRAIVKTVVNKRSAVKSGPNVHSSKLAAVGGLSHSKFRHFENDHKSFEYRKFIDGDLVESFLDLSARQMQEVVDSMTCDGWLPMYMASSAELTVSSVVNQVQAIARRH